MITPNPSGNSKRRKSGKDPLPEIPDKRYFSISEVGYLCGVKPHVLRYWEQEFPRLKPSKRRGNRRYYQLKDISVIREIRKLLYQDGFTIEGARAKITSRIIPVTPHQDDNKDDSSKIRQETTQNAIIIKKLLADLEGVLQQLTSETSVV